MRRAKRILLLAGMLLLCVSSAHAGWWGSRKADKRAESASIATISLTAIEIDGSRVVLRTSGAPAYTSYSPSPGVFVVDLTGTLRDASLAVPQTVPPAVTSISADEVTEMGSSLTRVTFRLADAINPEVSAIEKAVVITIPATAIPIASAASEEVLPPVVPATLEPAPAEIVAKVEPVPEPVVETIPEPQVVEEKPAAIVETSSLPRAKTLRKIDAKTADGNVEVRIYGDGQLEYKVFRLDNPARLVLDIAGVKNASAKTAVEVADDVVKRVRVAQFQPTVARVVVDLAQKTEYDIVAVGGELRIAFGTSAFASRTPAAPAPTNVTRAPEPIVVAQAAPKMEPAPKIEPAIQPVAQKTITPADIPSQVPTIAENAPEWKMPASSAVERPEPASKGARSVISAPQDQAPAQRPTTQEDVFADAAPQATTMQPMAGSRTLSSGPRVFNGEPLSLDLKDADLKDVLRTFAELTGLNIAIDPGVNGSVTVNFADVPWDQALDLILRQNNLTFVLEGNVMRIGTIERIAAETAATRRLAEEERLNVPMTSISVKLSYARAQDVSGLLRDIASPRARIITDSRTNQLIISEIPEFLRTMQNLIATVDIPTRQVMIEARIVESSRTFQQRWGFEWGFGGELNPANGSGTGLVFPNRIDYTGGPFSFGLGNPIIETHLFDVLGTFNLDLALFAAEVQGYIKVVSAPRVTTQDNTSAEIQSGVQIPYQTRVNFTTTVTYLDATLRLTVTPQITEAGTVIMDIAVQKNTPAEGLNIVGAAGTPINTRQARTRLMVRDGGTAVIAGIFQTTDNNGENRVPFVHNIPVIGNLFKSHNVSTSHDELLIFITPRIVRG